MTKGKDTASIIDAIAYLNQFRGSTFLIKLGGSILNSAQLIESLCLDLKLLKQAGINIVIVHGGSKAINQSLSSHDIESTFVEGLRVTSFEAMKIIEMVLCGHVNKVLVRKLNSIGMSAVGFSGADHNMLECDFYSKKHGYVGLIKSINQKAIAHLLSKEGVSFNAIPVIAPVGVNAEGDPMNVNADDAASHLANALAVEKLIYLTDQEGVYDQRGALYSELSTNDLEGLVHDGTVKDGMLTKVKAILVALKGNLNHVHILNGSERHVLIKELFTVHGIGTLCKGKQCVDQSVGAAA